MNQGQACADFVMSDLDFNPGSDGRAVNCRHRQLDLLPDPGIWILIQPALQSSHRLLAADTA